LSGGGGAEGAAGGRTPGAVDGGPALLGAGGRPAGAAALLVEDTLGPVDVAPFRALPAPRGVAGAAPLGETGGGPPGGAPAAAAAAALRGVAGAGGEGAGGTMRPDTVGRLAAT